ncbi:MAG: LCCL domain-containing protein [Bacteroidota bacterium]
MKQHIFRLSSKRFIFQVIILVFLSGQLQGQTVISDPGGMTGYRGNNGSSYDVLITTTASGGLWGCTTYTDDSRVSYAAIHQYGFSIGSQYIVRVVISAGLSSYSSCTQYGITSVSFGSWSGSYYFSTYYSPTNPTVTSSSAYNITSSGASIDGNVTGLGNGSSISRGDFSLTAGQVLKIVVGQRGLDGTVDDYTGSAYPQTAGGSGGGGSFVTTSSNGPLIIAGGGGGATTRLSTAGQVGGHGLTTTSGGSGTGDSGGPGGSGGSGGTGSCNTGYQGGSGGGGLTGSGGDTQGSTSSYGPISTGGVSFTGGAAGGTGGTGASVGDCRDGGFGGAGGYDGGGGGGYSGGGGGGDAGSGGGGSYNDGGNQLNTAGSNSGHGQVTITKL